jgi:hypothetical protein
VPVFRVARIAYLLHSTHTSSLVIARERAQS